MMPKKYDFGGWATKHDIQCSDSRIITKDAFKHNDGVTVPLVWNHRRNEMENIIGNVVLEHREDGVYAYGTFNKTRQGENAKELVREGDITSLSIYANRLQQKGNYVNHGEIREVSLVLAGANPEAHIDFVMEHSDGEELQELFYYSNVDLEHSDGIEIVEEENTDKTVGDDVEHKDTSEETLKDIVNSMNEKQKNVMYALIADAANNNPEGDNGMKHNLFDGQNGNNAAELEHAETLQNIIADAKRFGSLKESALQHGITDIEFLFPEARTLNNTPDFIQRDQGWVTKVMAGVHKIPFSRVKTIHADITADEARALGYIKGNLKKDEVFTLLKRTTEPQTIYKKQKLHRDDVIDITDMDVVAWLKMEMRMMLNEEIARAILVGDGRLSSSDDKIKEDKIRPVHADSDLYTIKSVIDLSTGYDAAKHAEEFIDNCIRARKGYKGSGAPSLYTTEDMLTEMLLLKDAIGHKLYKTEAELATALRVKEIITVPVMEGVTKSVEGATHYVDGIVLNLADYGVGADKGGAVNMFDDFDIDYNAQKYLIETRCSGAMMKPYSAISIESKRPAGRTAFKAGE